GDMGAEAYAFVDWLALAGQRYWQVMPLSPTGYGDSPYSGLSAFAGNPLMISIDGLAFLRLDAGGDSRGFKEHEVDFPAATAFKNAALRRAYDSFRERGSAELRQQFADFKTSQASWLGDFAFFRALKDRYRSVSWQDWPDDVRLRDQRTLAELEVELADTIEFYSFVQFLFRIQWAALKRYANERGIQIIGDIPIYVALDSADVWANQSQFRLHPDGSPEVVSGVPPDLFTEDGQLWGNPVFDWAAMQADGFAWWIERVRRLTELVDVVRIDHFRGLLGGWVVPAGDETARGGRWERAPGAKLFRAIEDELGELPIIVEDLGIITPDVDALRIDLGLQGMKVLQFAFDGDPDNAYLPHNYQRDCVVYTGTHDNQTTIGWFQSCSDAERLQVQTYLGVDGSDVAWDFIRLAFQSVADLAIAPLQDVMRLGDEARMNRPGIAFGNWKWRYLPHQLHDGLARGLRELSGVYGRLDRPRIARGYDPFDYSAPETAHPLFDRDGVRY
ncbi:MAG: 4-alpha-glucanotransferase, partial [Thermomicrobiales bacterium]|nr:4-alpha-glucanotransferase [Thermomicrobiales bacterium]